MVTGTGFSLDLQILTQRAADFGFRHASETEIHAGVKIAESLMNSKIASPEDISYMDELTQCTAWVTGDPVEGIFLTIPLTKNGVVAVRTGTYAPKRPAAEHLWSLGKQCEGFYIGVYAGCTKAARKKIMTAAAVLRYELFAAVPCFARGATGDGVRSMESLGFEPVSGGLPDLYCQEPIIDTQNQAA